MTLPKDFLTRMISAFFLLIVVTFPILKGGVFFNTFLILLSPVILFEWMRMASKRFWLLRGTLSSFGLCFILSLSSINSLSVLIFFLTFLFICIFSKLTNSSYKLSSFGFIYIALAIFSIFWIRESTQGLLSIIIILSTIIVSDVTAYLVGNWLGGPKLFKIISPNKTLSGFSAAIIFGSAWFYSLILIFTDKNEIKYFLIGLTFVLISIFGDLFISFLKRKAEIKDTSFLLPGHGGFLDRADSILPVFIIIPILVIIFDLYENPSLIILGW